MVWTGKSHPLDRGETGGLCQRLPMDLEIIYRVQATKLSFVPLLAAKME
jgi:hypothetical protein